MTQPAAPAQPPAPAPAQPPAPPAFVEPPAPAPAAQPPAPPAPTDPPSAGPGNPDPTVEPEKTVEYWQAAARKWEQQAKTNRDKATQLDKIEAANQTELEKAQKVAQESEERARAATLRAARAEIKTLADKFTDPDDAVLNLGDLTQYVKDDGDVDTKAVKSALDKVIEKKPHLAKAEPKTPTPTPPGVPVPTLRPGAAPDEPQRATSLADAIGRRLTST